MPHLPPLPAFVGDDALELTLMVHTSPSMVIPGTPFHPVYGNAERLADLGITALRFSATKYYFRKTPLLSVDEMKQHVDLVTENYDRINHWLDVYNIKHRLSLPQENGPSAIAEEHVRFFYTYIGAIAANRGTRVLDEWLFTLLNLEESAKVEDIDMTIDATQPPVYSSNAAPISPGSVPWNHPSASSASSLPSDSTPPTSILNAITLASFNQAAAQRKHDIVWDTSQTGPAHTPLFTAKCIIDGVVRGTSENAKTKKAAKEEAGRNAYIAMGWLNYN